ncbi:hypothetical protein D3C87_2098580 [compost metagenome]
MLSNHRQCLTTRTLLIAGEADQFADFIQRESKLPSLADKQQPRPVLFRVNPVPSSGTIGDWQ